MGLCETHTHTQNMMVCQLMINKHENICVGVPG